MQSTASRTNTLVTSLVYTVLYMALICGVITLNYTRPSAQANFDVRLNAIYKCRTLSKANPYCPFDVIALRAYDLRQVDRCDLNLDIRANLSSLFHWSTKQVFLWVVAEYETEKFQVNQIVLWDKIVERGKGFIISTRNAQPKYHLVDVESLLRNRSVSFSLHWDIQPYVGFNQLGRVEGSIVTVQTPEEYK